MRLITLSLFAISLFAGGLNAQEKKPTFLEKKNQNCIEVEAFPAFSYSYAHKFKPKLTLGLRFQVGLGIRFLLTNPSFYTICDQCPAGSGPAWEEVKTNGGGVFFDLLKLQFFYRLNPSKHFLLTNPFYFDIGPYATVGFMGDFGMGITAGLEGSVFYTIRKFHIGTRVVAGWQFFLYKKFTSNYFGLYSVPLVIGANF